MWSHGCVLTSRFLVAAQYNYLEDSRRLAYRWLYLLTVSFVDFKMIPEKYVALQARRCAYLLTLVSHTGSTPSLFRTWSRQK